MSRQAEVNRQRRWARTGGKDARARADVDRLLAAGRPGARHVDQVIQTFFRVAEQTADTPTTLRQPRSGSGSSITIGGHSATTC